MFIFGVKATASTKPGTPAAYPVEDSVRLASQFFDLGQNR